MSNLTDFARDELTRAGLFSEGSDYDGMLGDAVMRLVNVFADEGHSGMSASMAVSIFKRVALFEPLTPLTGDEDEWGAPFDGNGGRQNKRCSHVFMDVNGNAYDIQGKIFREPSGSCYQSGDSRVSVIFPYTPTTEYVDVPEQPADDDG